MTAASFLLRRACVAAVLTLGACDGDDDDGTMDSANDDSTPTLCEQETRADDFMVDLTKTGQRHRVVLVGADPAEPVRGDNMWEVSVADLEGNAMAGVEVDAKPWMPDHGHGTSVEETVTELGEGRYRLDPLNLHMAGLWEVTLELTDEGGELDSVMIAVCVE